MPQKHVVYRKITIMDEEIDVDDFKFLCIIVNMHIKWSSHTESIVNKIYKYVVLTNRLKHILPLRILRTLSNTLIIPDVYYGILL